MAGELMHINNTCCCHTLLVVAQGFQSLSGNLSAHFNSTEGESSTLEFSFVYQRHLPTRNKFLLPEVIDVRLKLTGNVERKVVLPMTYTSLRGGARV
jgi:hypothetical protein